MSEYYEPDPAEENTQDFPVHFATNSGSTSDSEHEEETTESPQSNINVIGYANFEIKQADQDNKNKIAVTIQFDKSDLVCAICYDGLVSKIYQCIKGPHNLCEKCHDSGMVSSCPICKNPKSFFRALYMEAHLKQFLTDCPNKHHGCPTKIFNWEKAHEDCKYEPITCPLCSDLVKSDADKLAMHLQIECKKKENLLYCTSYGFENQLILLFCIKFNNEIKFGAFSRAYSRDNTIITFKKKSITCHVTIPIINNFTGDYQDNMIDISDKLLSYHIS